MSTGDQASDLPNDVETADEPLRRERDDLLDRLLRMTAEFDNYRKRTDRERRDLIDTAATGLIRELLPVVDDLERALAAPVDRGPGAAAVEQYRSGFELILRQFLDILRRRGVEPVDALGQIFDPAWHEALGDEPADGRPDGEITAEVRRGYRIGTKLIRPALVRVAKA
jgi:molecular chaperone GrpE